MAVAATTASTAPATGAQPTNAATNRLLSNYDTFLQLLTTQLRVQNPMEPMDAEKFTEQLVQYSAVEQQIQANQKLEKMLEALASNSALGLVNYIGKSVDMTSDTTMLKDGKATWQINAAAAAPKTTISIRNDVGALVWEGDASLQEGSNAFEWDGRTAGGNQLPDGAYSISISAASSEGTAVGVSTKVSGTVSAIDTSSGAPFLEVNGKMVPLSGLLRVGS